MAVEDSSVTINGTRPEPAAVNAGSSPGVGGSRGTTPKAGGRATPRLARSEAGMDLNLHVSVTGKRAVSLRISEGAERRLAVTRI